MISVPNMNTMGGRKMSEVNKDEKILSLNEVESKLVEAGISRHDVKLVIEKMMPVPPRMGVKGELMRRIDRHDDVGVYLGRDTDQDLMFKRLVIKRDLVEIEAGHWFASETWKFEVLDIVSGKWVACNNFCEELRNV